MTRLRRMGGYALIALSGMLPAAAVAQDAAPGALSFEAALLQLDKASPGLSGDAHEVRASEATAAATRSLRLPTLSTTLAAIEYQKTLSLDLSGAKAGAATATSGLLAALPGAFPADLQPVAAQVAQRIGAALPGVFAAIPDDARFRIRRSSLLPTVTAEMPLYTGGAIPAAQRGAAAMVGVAQARQAGGRDLSRVALVRAYFGQQVAAQLTRSTAETLRGFERHLSDARSLERNGVVPHARVLQVQVARDAAQRAFERAQLEEATATDTLSRLLERPEGIATLTPLFVASTALPPVGRFLDGVDATPLARGADAARTAASARVGLARSEFRPRIGAFGTYNLYRDDAPVTQPDWVAGVALRYTLLSNAGRRDKLDAARERERAAADAATQVRKDVASEIVRAWNLVETARRSFLLLDGNLAAAQENLRVQQVAFREGEATSSALIDAESALSTTQTQRIAAAYEYDLALIGLLAASHRVDDFTTMMTHADRRLGDR